MKPSVAFLGIGRMGSRMAPHLARAGYPVLAWNRSPEKALALASHGIESAASAADAVRSANVVITMLANGPTVEEVLLPLVGDLPRETLVIDMSSIPPDFARRHAHALAERGLRYLDAPVSGGTIGAEQASLAIMVGGEMANFTAAETLLAVLGRPTHVGPVGCGQLTKLCNQIIVATTIGAVSEALLLASAGGADPAAVRQALLGGFADSRILREHGQRMLKRDFLPGGITAHQLKDLNTALAAAARLPLRLPVAELIRDLFQGLQDHGGAGYDHTALLLELERANPGQRLGTAPDKLP